MRGKSLLWYIPNIWGKGGNCTPWTPGPLALICTEECYKIQGRWLSLYNLTIACLTNIHVYLQIKYILKNILRPKLNLISPRLFYFRIFYVPYTRHYNPLLIRNKKFLVIQTNLQYKLQLTGQKKAALWIQIKLMESAH